MKKLLFILPVFFFTVAVNAQIDFGTIPVGDTYGNFRGFAKDPRAIPANGEITVTGIVLSTGVPYCLLNRCTVNSITLQRLNNSNLVIGTKDYSFTLPQHIVGRGILVEGIDIGQRNPEKKSPRVDYQKDIQFAATGIKIIK